MSMGQGLILAGIPQGLCSDDSGLEGTGPSQAIKIKQGQQRESSVSPLDQCSCII